MELLQPCAKAHFYTHTGSPCHEVKCKTKDAMRPTTIRDARELNLLPSVTTILGLLAKPGLDVWKIEQGIMSALTLPRLPDEDDQAFAARVVIDMGEHSKKAMSFGSRIHWYAEQWLHGEIPGHEEDAVTVEPYITPLYAFMFQNKMQGEAEKTMASARLGFAGTVDFVGRMNGEPVIADFKTQGTKKGKINFYGEWSYQLAAYEMLVCEPNRKLVSIAISSTEPGVIECREWTAEEVSKARKIFLNTLEIFKLTKNL